MTLSVALLSDDQRVGLGVAFIFVGWANLLANGAIVFVSWLFRRTARQPNRILLALAIGYLFNSVLWAFAPTFFNPGHGLTCFFMMIHTFGRFSTILMELLILLFTITTLLNHKSEAIWSWRVESVSYVVVHLLSLVVVIVFGSAFAWPCGGSGKSSAIDKVDIITEMWLAILGICLLAAVLMVYKYRQLRIVWQEEGDSIESGWYTSVERHQKKTIMKVHQQLVESLVDPLLAYPIVFLLFAIPDIIKVALDSQWGQSNRQELLSACVNLFAGLRGIAFAYVYFKEGDNMEMLRWSNVKRKWGLRRRNTHVAFGNEEVREYTKSGTIRSIDLRHEATTTTTAAASSSSSPLSSSSTSSTAPKSVRDSLHESLLSAEQILDEDL